MVKLMDPSAFQPGVHRASVRQAAEFTGRAHAVLDRAGSGFSGQHPGKDFLRAFFTLKDQRKGQKYLWMAERINGGRILLTSTRSSVDFVPSSACYQEYRNKLTQPLSINTKTLDI